MVDKKAIVRWLLVGTAAIGVFGVAGISYRQFTGLSQCPQLGILPACYIVLICYASMLLAAFRRTPIMSWFFWIGWLGAFAMAITGTGLELAGIETCPRTGDDTPTCYFSLAIAMVLALLFVLSSEKAPSDER